MHAQLRHQDDAYSFDDARREFYEAASDGYSRDTQRGAIAWQVTREAEAYAQRAGLSPYEMTGDLLNSIKELFLAIKSGAPQIELADGNSGSVIWRHAQTLLVDMRREQEPSFDRTSAGNAATRYLSLPFRVTTLDRLLVDLMMAMRLYQLGAEMRTKHKSKVLRGIGSVSVYLRYAISGLVLVGGAVLANYAGTQSFLSPNWVGNITVVIAGLFALLAAADLLTLPFRRLQKSRRRRKFDCTLEAMAAAYAELGSGGFVSATHIRQRSYDAAHSGVIWPGPLFVLLDDAIARTGRL